MEYERKTMLQTVYKFLEKIEDKLPTVLSYECRRIKESMNNMGVCPKYINMPDENPLQKTTIEPRQRTQLKILKINSSTATPIESTIKEHISRPNSSLEICHNDRSSSPISTPSSQVTTNCKGWKSSFSPTSNSNYHNMKFMTNEPRKKLSPNTNISHICKSPLPSTPTSTPIVTTITSKEMQQSPYHNTPSLQSPYHNTPSLQSPCNNTPSLQSPYQNTRSLQSPKSTSTPIGKPKKPGLVGDNVTFLIGNSVTMPECFAQYDTKSHKYENVGTNTPKGNTTRHHQRNTEKRGMILS
ncbi:hypothetical protein LOD99_3581 [Oopsacas minuta]|uniref:Uncharacterized protein n=1 Tax=Oopsacas minuta TaxID=111878 RepID=A0AAV7JWS0_9METZ|nr:hypothetical protein LOD99_3581 [Oopsacas minuta]